MYTNKIKVLGFDHFLFYVIIQITLCEVSGVFYLDYLEREHEKKIQ